ncbi:hypothetical protein CERZMDRAFT_95508 [Cercospora zeae-maydis SCOH1-5]|uniref:Uncharacterized protein n=1 Tax=Cercospora zeae-maydis SCOH1-5 TaxID=717836 RepID=A0A6A6FLK1_9PEZI|nr:hypothetical protein CERZMDRAFT_95508 [Cercospora zeae-maydis SCOH1-5]
MHIKLIAFLLAGMAFAGPIPVPAAVGTVARDADANAHGEGQWGEETYEYNTFDKRNEGPVVVDK